MDEAPRERAISSEPCSGRPNPFDDVTEQVSRKRQRLSRGGSRSRSVDAARDTDIVPDSMLVREGNPKAEANPPPSTPTREPSEPPTAEPTSSRVTINLRTNRTLEAIPSSPPSPSTPSKMVHGADDAGTRISIESESDALSTIPPIETPSSSPSPIGSPQVELIPMDNDDSDFNNDDPPVAIINDDSDYLDPMSNFPYNAEGETLVNTVGRLARFMQNESIDDDACFCRLRDWIDSYLFANNDLELFYQSFAKNREFWNCFPDLIWCLSYRSRFFGDFLKKSREGRQALTEMLCQFARLTGKFLAMDARTLDYHARNNNDQEPDLGSRLYLSAFSFLLRKEEHSHIGRNLEAHYQWNWDDDAALMSDSFQTEGGTILSLTKLVRGQLSLMSRNPKLVDAFTDPCRLACKIFLDAAANFEDGNQQHAQVKDAAWLKINQGYEFYTAMSVGLEAIIEKHVTFLSPEAATAHLYNLPLMLKIAVSLEVPAIHELLENKRREQTMLLPKQFKEVISKEWKFSILKKLITSAQMQLRVVGVTTMCSDLLELYQRNKGLDPTASPILLYFAEFVLANELVDYIVGIGSHPEIINESNNILGFLIVTKTYKSQQTDKIWQTVMTSQDPRVVEAILRMVMRCLNLYDYRALLYICKKVCDVPIESFTVPMREFSQNLFKDLVLKISDAGQYLGPPPYDLCVRLIRESSIISAECPLGHPEIQAFGASRLRELLQFGPSPESRTSIYLSCLEDISNRSPTAPGSICVINGLIRQNILDLRRLCNEHGLTQLVIEELESAVAADRHSTARNSPAGNARRELLMALIIHEPATINPDLGKRLWDVLVGSASKSALERNSSWLILNSATKKSSTKNVFLASCYKDYLPKLPPYCFTTGALDFAREAIFAWLEEVRRDFVAEDRTFESHALEQLWRMILTAPPNTIDAAAISILVEVYVDNPLILAMPRAKARSIHLALVDRCLDQLKTAASKLKTFSDGASSGSDEGMVIVASEDQFQEQEKIFARSLAVLREFLRAYQSKPQFATPKPRSTTTLTTTDVEGEPLTVKYQSFDGNTHTEVKSLTLGKLNTAAALFASLQKATGFKNYKVYCGGKEFDPDEIEVCKSLDDLNLNGLVLIQRREDSDGFPGYVNGVKPTLESEIMKHFDDLWGYLSMHEKVAQEIYYFLVKFPVFERLLRDFDTDTPHSEIFPLGQPFKSLYAIHALKEYIAGQTQKGSVNETALTRAISLIVAALSDRDVLNHCANDDLRDCLALHLIDCFVHFMKEPITPTSIAPYLNDILLQRLLQLLHDAQGIQSSQNSVHLTWRSFEAILEACIHNPELWSHFASHLASSTLLQELLLDDPRPLIRKSVAKHIMSKCTFSPSLAQVSTSSFVIAFWPMVASLIAEATKHPYQCEEIFGLAHTLLKRLAETSADFLKIEDCVKHWGGLLLNHDRQESVGHPESVDLVAQGLATLLLDATTLVKASQALISCSSIGPALFGRHLFPDLTVDDEEEIIVPTVPLLNPVTRRILAETILNLVKDDDAQYRNILTQLSALVPYVASEDGPYAYDLPFLFDRSKSIRSQTGYVGLKNLSNTCYLNSLFTQLYMNIPFREFMLNAHVADGGAAQKLLSETQNLFSYMQNSFQRSVSPANLASSIRTYEDGQIDINIQMDVDEFYNLLFDRWESQILAPDAKRKFRSFYGGQLVQQVKSKECSHISERLEPFSAIQCDIKGKSSLQESLQAYVDGEVMEGDNKYKCSGCDRHVDAVKRACLKDIPNNLIFHLKRFDFNLRTLQRSKINDHFSFPTKIDMRPYKVEHLMDNPEETPEDVFELVGILVHSGTAESGHYYSFIRERPSNGEKENWVEFNDDNVSPWDPNQMENSCFGGPDYRGPVDGGNLQYDKAWSAYMLFYQRSSELAVQKQSLQLSGMASPLHLPISPRLSNHIAMENELFLRKYCLYDPSHAAFVTKALSHVKKINGGQCSQSHTLEKLALHAALNHMDQVFARGKDLPDFPAFMVALRQTCHQCAECSRDYLEWYCDLPETLRVLLLRNPDGLVRTEIASSIIAALNKVNADAPYAYGFGDDEEIDADDLEGGDPQVIQRTVKTINRLWDMFHTNIRAWPEYFGLLSSIAKMGKCEATLLLDAGYLRRTLELISADAQLPISTQYSRMLGFINKRVATRPVSYECVITLLWRLLDTCDASIDPVADDDDRIDIAMNNMPIPLTVGERNLLLQHWTRTDAHIVVEKLLHIHQNDYATESIIVALLNWPETLDDNIYAAITHGIRRNVTSAPCGPFLRAALTYCQHSTEPRALVNMVTHVTKVASHVENVDGKEFLQFFKDIMTLQCEHSDMEFEEMHQFFLEQATQWGPGLLTYYDMAVRADTEDFLQEFVLKPASDASDQDFPEDEHERERARVAIVAGQKLGVACLEYLQDSYVRPRQTAVRAVVTNILTVVDTCQYLFDVDSKDHLTRRYTEMSLSVIPAIKKNMVEEADEEVSDWDGSQDDYDGSSEPMDSIAELGPADNDDAV